MFRGMILCAKINPMFFTTCLVQYHNLYSLTKSSILGVASSVANRILLPPCHCILYLKISSSMLTCFSFRFKLVEFTVRVCSYIIIKNAPYHQCFIVRKILYVYAQRNITQIYIIRLMTCISTLANRYRIIIAQVFAILPRDRPVPLVGQLFIRIVSIIPHPVHPRKYTHFVVYKYIKNNIKAHRYWPFGRGIQRWPVHYPCEAPV